MLGMTQSEVAARVPCAVVTVRKIEADERRPSQLVATRLAEALELDDIATSQFVTASRTAFSPALAPADDARSGGPQSAPAPTTAIIGREGELADLVDRLAPAGGPARLLTITGPPGVGKTRLAIELAHRIETKLDLRVAWVDLAGVAEPSMMATAIARAVTPPGLHGIAGLDRLAVGQLQQRPTVLMLDNCEHLLDGVDCVTSLLTACPALVVVATSRARLDLHGEHEMTLAPLPTSTEDGKPGPAISLFTARAREVGCLEALEDDPIVRSIVDRLGGFPLAIELAALRLREHRLDELVSRLASGLDVLGANRRGVRLRHASIDDAVAWSVSLLEPPERSVLEALAVFPRGSDTETVAHVADLPTSSVVAALWSLVDAALVARPPRHTEADARFVPYVIVSEHVVRSQDPDRLADRRRRHAAAVLRLAAASLPGITAWPEPHHLAALGELDDDLHVALSTSFGADGDAGVGVQLAVLAVSGWFLQGRIEECRRWAHAAMSADADSHVSLYLDALVRWRDGDRDAVDAMLRALQAADSADEAQWAAECAGMAQAFALGFGDLERAQHLATRAIARGAQVGGEWEALAHLRNGFLSIRLHHLDDAHEHAARCAAAYDAIGSTWGRAMASVLGASLADAEGRRSAAAHGYLDAIERFSALGLTDQVVKTITDCGLLVLHAGRADLAAVLYGMVEGWVEELHAGVSPTSSHRMLRGRQAAAEILGPGFAEASARGRSMMRNLDSVRGLLADAGLMAPADDVAAIG
jgi:predicted ATPase/DNA-binding XRE family transcriptional regulator